MRQVFTSVRLENVERVAKLLEDEGIEVRITNGRSYKGTIRGNFTYRNDIAQQQAAVWIVRSEDQPRARAMLREAGLMSPARGAGGDPGGSHVALSFRDTGADAHEARLGRRRAVRIRLGLVAVIAVILVLGFMTRNPSSPVPTAAQPAGSATTAESTTPTATPLAPTPTDLLPRGKVATPDSLAVALLRGELPERASDVACLAVDGRDPSATLLAALPATPGRVLPLSQCPASAGNNVLPPQILEIGKYVANDAGTGTIFLQRRRVGGRAVPQWYEVRREGGGWRVIQPL